MDLRILGPLEVWSHGNRVEVGSIGQQAVLAALALKPGESVSTTRLAEVLWNANPPATARRQVHKRIHGLRQALGDAIVTDGPGYRLAVPAQSVDAHRFTAQVEHARKLRLAGQDDQAAAELRAALLLWRGPALAGLADGALAREATRLDEDRMIVLEECLDLELATGRHAELLAELRSLVQQHPFQERLVERLMLALYRSGRQADALETYQRLRVRMSRDLGMEPTDRLRQLHASILRQHPALIGPAAAEAEPALPAPVPACLPMDLPSFVGRTGELSTLNALCEAGTPTVAIAAITGMAGVGKTALAVHWAHQVRDRFPDGQLYVDLRGHDTAPAMTAAEALTVFLRELGTPADQIPAEPDALAGVYRSIVDGKRMLVVLDNASGVDQIRPLLPGSGGNLVLVTSRTTLNLLAVLHDAHRIPLGVLPDDEALSLLRRVLGADRVTAEPAAAEELLRLCGNLPLALRITAANLAARPQESVTGMVRALADRDRLAELGVDGEPQAGVRAVFDVSYRAVPPAAGRLLCLIGSAPVTDIGAEAAAALAGTPLAETRELLATLESTHLVERHQHDRYRLHDLIALYARTQGTTGAVRRLLEFYIAGTDAAVTSLARHMRREPRPFALPTPPAPTDWMTWLQAERLNLVAAVSWAHDHGEDLLGVHLVDALRGYFYLQRCMTEWFTTGEQGLAMAERLADLRLQAAMHRALGLAHFAAENKDEAAQHTIRSLRLYEELDDWAGVATAHINLGCGYNATGQTATAAEHLLRATEISATHGRPDDELTSLLGLSMSRMHQGRPLEAATGIARALEISRRTGNPVLLGHTHGMHGWICFETGQLAQAEEHLAAALRANVETGDKNGEVSVITWLGHFAVLTGATQQAEEHFGRAIDLAGEARYTEQLIWATVGLAGIRQDLAMLAGALHLAQDSGCFWGEVRTLTALARLHLARHDTASAARCAAESIRLCTENEWLLYLGEAHRVTAGISLATGDHAGALDQVTRALAVHRQTGQHLQEAADLVLLSRLRHEPDLAATATDICRATAGVHAGSVVRELFS